MHRGGRILRHRWSEIGPDALEHACLLAALSPEVVDAQDPAQCPANVMPGWLAYLTPDLADFISDTYWPHFVECYVQDAARWHKLDAPAWERCNTRVCIAALEVALPHDQSGVVERMLGLLRRRLAGDEPTAAEWEEAQAQAQAQTWVAWVASTSAVAVREVAEAAATAEAVAWAAAWAASADARGARGAGDAAKVAAWDRIAKATLDAIEAEIVAAEAQQ